LAIEALATSYTAEQTPVEREELTSFDQFLASAEKKGISPNKRMVEAVRTVLGDLPLARKFELFRRHHAERLGAPKADLETFREARTLRNQIMHGRVTELPWEKATPVKQLLERLLGAVLSVPLLSPQGRVYHTDLVWSVGTAGTPPAQA
jgi:hypothetical protein